jgi:Arc/MetJ-type ribon-helix-helix transcriptional regulator
MLSGSYHDKKLSVRLSEDVLNSVNDVVRNNPNIYFNNSHFIRCAVIKLLKEEGVL